MRPYRWLFVVLVLAAGVAGCPASRDKPITHLQLTVICNPVGNRCTASDSRHHISLRLDPELTYLKPFGIEVKTRGIGSEPANRVTVRFGMTGMEMGLNRFRLQPVDGSGADPVYHGEGMLPVCVTGRSDWQALVEVEAQGRRYQAVFDFSVARR